MQFINQPRADVLLNGRNTATDADILVFRCILSELQRGMDSARHEVKRCTAFHLDRFAWMMGQHESRYMIRRFLAPPSFPRVVLPWAAHRAEHVAPQNPGADVRHTSLRPFVINTGRAAFGAVHLLPRARR